MRRATTHTFSFLLPREANYYSELLVTISQDEEQIINRRKNELRLEGTKVSITLTQEETLRFVAGVPAKIQIRAYANATDAPGSRIWTVPVFPSLNEEVLS